MTEKAVISKPYRYFDTPDGQDTFKKLWCVLRPTLIVAGGAGIFDVMARTYPKGYKASALRFCAVGLPIVGIASTFVLATNGLASIRKKDDRLNWFLGGFVTGTCFGLWARRPITGFNMGMAIGILAFFRKECAIHGYVPFPATTLTRRGGVHTCHFDCSLTKERPKTWVTSAE